MPWPLRLRSKTQNDQHQPSKSTAVASPTRGYLSHDAGSARGDLSSGSGNDQLGGVHGSSRRRPHVRSSSQPFPSLVCPPMSPLKNGSGRHTRGASMDSCSDPFLELTDEEHAIQARMALSSKPRRQWGLSSAEYERHHAHAPSRAAPPVSRHEHGRHYTHHDRELVKLRCMTCAFFNAIPRSRKSFRCTRCGTINDLEPYREPSNVDPHTNKEGRRDAMPWNRVYPLTVDQTRAIVDNCLTGYLSQFIRLDGPPTENAPSANGLHTTGTGSGSSPSKFVAPDYHHGRAFNPLLTPANHRDKGKNPLRALAGGKSDESSTDSPNSSSPSGTASSEFNPSSPNSQNGQKPATTEKHRCRRIRFSATRSQMIFRPLVNHLHASFDGCDTLNSSFLTIRAHVNEKNRPPTPPLKDKGKDVADARQRRHQHKAGSEEGRGEECGIFSTSKTPRIDWDRLSDWYQLVVNVGSTWQEKWKQLRPDTHLGPREVRFAEVWDSIDTSTFEKEIEEARRHVRVALLRVTEDVLVRPKRPLRTPDDIRFMLILLANPLLSSSDTMKDLLPARTHLAQHGNEHEPAAINGDDRSTVQPSKKGHHGPANLDDRDHCARIAKRILGTIANLNMECHRVICAWFSRYTENQMQRMVDFVNRFLTHRLTKNEKRKRHKANGEANINDFVPMFPHEGTTPAQLHDAISRVHISKPSEPDAHQLPAYIDDWQIHAASKAMALLFIANSSSRARKLHGSPIIPLNAFYNTFFDYANMVADFEAWEARRGRFTVCQHSFLLSLFVKIKLLEFEAHRQMEEKARHAFFTTVLTRTPQSQFMMLKVRRQCLVEDSLTGVSEVVATGHEDIKKGLRIEFIGEEGVDAGGLRKEWFLLLTRDIFNPDHGLFLYDEDSHYAYFNPYCLESSEQFYLVGVLLGLAIYNSTILDIALPPFLFKKLLASTPKSITSPGTAAPNSSWKPTLEDLAEYRPSVAKGLQCLLDYEGDARDLCLDFVTENERYGERIVTPLCHDGERRAVTNSNKREYVSLYVRHLLEESVARQFNPFKNGFFTVCAGNALHLFRPEEIELLVRGSDEPLDIHSLKAAAAYAGFGSNPTSDKIVNWFWDFFSRASPKNQRKILSFITGSDRIPATGAANLSMKISLIGNDCERYPVAHTCYNQIGLYRYPTRTILEEKLWRAIVDSQGFGLK